MTRLPCSDPVKLAYDSTNDFAWNSVLSEKNMPNEPVQLIAGLSNFRAEATVAWRSGTGDAGGRASRVPSLPSGAFISHLLPAIPDGGRSPKNKFHHPHLS